VIEETPISSETNLIENGGFEQLTEGWTFIGGAGIATNHIYEGQYLAYLDIGKDKQLLQSIQIQQTGTYRFTSYVSA